MPLKILASFCLYTIYVCQGYAQLPGGVSSPKVWYTTQQVNDVYNLKDISGHSYPSLISSDETNYLDVNFHPAFYFSGKYDTLKFTNLDLSQCTAFAAIFPYYDALAIPEANQNFYSITTNGQSIFKIFFDRIEDVEEGQTLSYPDNPIKSYVIRNNDNLAASMKISNYARATKNVDNIWRNLKQTNLNVSLKGYCPEIIIYTRPLNQTNDTIKVETYLAIKYGLTLPENFVGSDNTVLWNANANAIYHHRVCGIGKDINGATDQKISTTTYEDGKYFSYDNDANDNKRSVTIGFDDIDYKKLPDRAFLFWGDNNKLSSSFYRFSGINKKFEKVERAERTWMIENKKNISANTKLKVAGGQLEYLMNKSDTPQCYFLIKLHNRLESNDLYPLSFSSGNNTLIKDSLQWNSVDSFTFGRCEKLRFDTIICRIFERIHSDCTKDGEYFMNRRDFQIPRRCLRCGYYYRKPTTDVSFNENRHLTEIPNDSLEIFFSGGIPPYQYKIYKKGTNSSSSRFVDLVDQQMEEEKDDGILIYRINSAYPSGSYTIILRDATNQVDYLQVQL